jgi:dihydrofolate reductase
MKVILYMAITVNGMIAKKNGGTSWSDEELVAYENIVRKFGNLIIGRKTYEVTEKSDFESVGNLFTVVVTSNKDFKSKEKIKFVDSIQDALKILEDKGFSEVLVAGGGKLNTSFMKAGLVDEIYLDVEPLVFGEGILLFSPVDFQRKLKLLEVKKLSDQTIQLHYKVLN